MSKIRHILGISGGKDSAALAIYLKQHYPQLEIEYYFSDTGKELPETYDFIAKLEIFLGQSVYRLKAAEDSPEDPFDHFLALYGGFLPSPNARWCTRKLKLEPFEQKLIGNDLAISYVAIRGDEDREGYISQRPNIQTIFPFRRNIWSKDVVTQLLQNTAMPQLIELYTQFAPLNKQADLIEIASRPLSAKLSQAKKLDLLLDASVSTFNQVMFAFLKTTTYPLAQIDEFPLLDNEDIINRDGVFELLENSGVGKPGYYKPIEFEVNGQKGFYNRSRSGCYFCFFQQKIEWIWLYEQHKEDFIKAMAYEKDGFTWMQDERLEDLIQPERVEKIKMLYLHKTSRNNNSPSKYLVDVLQESEDEGCLACFM